MDIRGGIDVIENQIFKDNVARGDKEHLIVADLETGATTTVAEIPLTRNYQFGLKWISENTLQYTMPDGTMETYMVK